MKQMNDILIILADTQKIERRLIFVLLIVFLLLIIIAGYLQKLVGYIMRQQGLKVDTMMYNILTNKVIVDKKIFLKEAYRKSMVYFVKKAYLPFIGILICTFAILIYGWANNNDFSYYTSGIDSFSYHFYFPTTTLFGMTVISNWPSVVKTPDFSFEISKYYALVFTVLLIISGLIYLYQVQAYISRCLRIRQLARKYFIKELVNESTNKQI